jgi:hypothetical protein
MEGLAMKKNNAFIVLKKLRKKIWLNRLLNTTVYFGLGISGTVFLMAVLSHVFPIVYVGKKIFYIVEGGLLLGVLYSLFKIPSIEETAEIGDDTGFKERFSTYLEYRNCHGEIYDAFFDEMEESLSKEDIGKKYHIKIDKKMILISLIIFFISLGIFFIPSNKRDIAQSGEEINKDLKEEGKKVENIVEDLKKEEKNGNITSEEEKEMKKTLKKLIDKLSDTYDYEEGAYHILDAQRDLDNINKKYDQDNSIIASIFNGTGIQSSLNKEVSNISGDLSEEYRQKALKNIQDMKSDGEEKMSQKDLNVINQMERELKSDDWKENVRNIADGKSLSNSVETAQVDLNDMKERFLDKDGNGFESIGGKDKTESFTFGERDNYEEGERNKGDYKESIAGKGLGDYDDSGGIGGDGKGENDVSLQEGNVKKSTKSTRIDNEKSNLLNIQGVQGEKGDIITNSNENGIGTSGIDNLLTGSYREFEKDKLKYINKYKIPEKNKELVNRYFEILTEEK